MMLLTLNIIMVQTPKFTINLFLFLFFLLSSLFQIIQKFITLNKNLIILSGAEKKFLKFYCDAWKGIEI